MATLPPQPRKRLGQHFLIDPNLLRKIVNFADITAEDSVCEIGPGGGALTWWLCQKAKQVLALEVDSRMVDFLKTELAEHANLEIREQDALRYSFNDLPESTIVVANLPYNISTPILFQMLEAKSKIRRMVLTVQLEVAQRLAAKPSTKAYGVLSVMAQHLAEVQFGFRIPKQCFRPIPDVDSGVVRLEIRQPIQETQEEQIQFQRVVRAAFSQRRKTLRNTLKHFLSQEHIEVCGVDPGSRAETVSVADFTALTSRYCELV